MARLKYKDEKRCHARIKKNLPIKIKHKDFDFDIVTETKDISCAGAYCQVDRYLAPLTKIKTKILLPFKKKNKSQYIDCTGIVVRSEKTNNNLEEQYNIAIYFNEINKTNMQKINHFIKDRDNTNKIS